MLQNMNLWYSPSDSSPRPSCFPTSVMAWGTLRSRRGPSGARV